MGERRQKKSIDDWDQCSLALSLSFSRSLSFNETIRWQNSSHMAFILFRFLLKRRVKEMMGRGKELCAPAHPDHLLELSCTEFGQSKETDRQTERQTQSRWDYS